MQTKIKIVDLSKKFRHLVLLENVDLDVPQNSIVGIVGPNGSGKTTLLKMICGLSYPDEGEIYIDGKALHKGELASSVGVVLGNPAFIDTMTGIDNLKYLASIQDKIGDKEIHEAMERVGLNPSLKTKVKEIVSIEGKVRNMAAHEIVSVTDDWFKKNTGKTVSEIMGILKFLIKKAGINVTEEDWASYDRMNQKIVELLERK